MSYPQRQALPPSWQSHRAPSNAPWAREHGACYWGRRQISNNNLTSKDAKKSVRWEGRS